MALSRSMLKRNVNTLCSTAFVSPDAKLGDNVTVGRLATVGAGVHLKDGVVVLPYAIVQGNTVVGENTVIHPFASVGGDPQSRRTSNKAKLIIGSNCVLREYVSINVGTSEDTLIGNNVWLLANSHVGHDCTIGNSVVISNGSQIAGHVKIGDRAIVGGLSAVLQFCVLGEDVMVGGGSMIDKHVPPYGLVVGNRAKWRGVNLRGLRRQNIPNKDILPLLSLAKACFASENPHDFAKSEYERLQIEKNLNKTLSGTFLYFIASLGSAKHSGCARRASLGFVPLLQTTRD